MWSAANQKLPVIFVITNNKGYQILKNRLKLFHGNDKPIGMDFNDPPMDIAAMPAASASRRRGSTRRPASRMHSTRRWPGPTARR